MFKEMSTEIGYSGSWIIDMEFCSDIIFPFSGPLMLAMVLCSVFCLSPIYPLLRLVLPDSKRDI